MMQYPHWDANLLVVVATLIAVAIVVLIHYEGLAIISSWLAKRRETISRRNVLYGIFSVLALHVLEIWVFGITVWLLLKYPETGHVAGADPLHLLDSIYLASVTYTTVGFGDVTPIGPIRLIAGTMSLTGFVLITWSASFTYLEMERFWRK
jgi:uncharacterized protein YhhL (DUF1145 family)